MEDALEMSDQSTLPCVGTVLEELAEVSRILFYWYNSKISLRKHALSVVVVDIYNV